MEHFYQKLINTELSISGTDGQFRTPRYIIKMIVELMKTTASDIIIDPE
ncbi:N-6 DNA methylase [Wansuia hejianensis]|uniref:SAM-dependent DNA methyltransferase n=1 Tax=Wansuia hejianensis TaxID=2763667 RepID=A0A926ILX4_9FIRM|nr:N-6 DNA methylase [Wansuia hejianensis]MBC8589996.1 SAM-dependent DNA methyltransferase [Wansuia hejianensis]